MKKLRFPFFSKNQSIVANTKQIVDFKTGKPISEGISGGSGKGSSESNVLTLHLSLKTVLGKQTLILDGIEGTIQQVKDIIKNEFSVKFILNEGYTKVIHNGNYYVYVEGGEEEGEELLCKLIPWLSKESFGVDGGTVAFEIPVTFDEHFKLQLLESGDGFTITESQMTHPIYNTLITVCNVEFD